MMMISVISRRLYNVLLVAAFLAVAGGTPRAYGAEDYNVGDVQTCVPLGQIDDSRIIDDKTILLRMVLGSPYRRVDLAQGCAGLAMSESFSSATSISQLCQQDVLRVARDPVGSQCIIDKIIIIDESEAKTLLARRKK